MPIGTVKWFDCKKGFGFIIGPDEQDVFVHFSIIVGEGFRRLRDGEEVEYDFESGPKGLSATSVRHLETRTPATGSDGQPAPGAVPRLEPAPEGGPLERE